MTDNRPTLKEIADIAGVSIATVSYVLNGKKKVSENTKMKVLSIMKELNYTPNLFARNLRKNDSKLVFALTSSFASVFYGEILGHIESEFEKYGYQMLALSGLIPSILKSNVFDGGIILNYALSSEEMDSLSANVSKKLISLSGENLNSNLNVVCMDNESGMKQILKEITFSKHQNVCFIQGKTDSLNNIERYNAAKHYYQKYFQKNDFDIRVFQGGFDTAITYQLALNLLKSKEYNMFVCFNDAMALGVYQAAAELNLTIGKDLSLTGFDNIFWADHMTPKLTTINIDKELWAKKIVQNYLNIDISASSPEKIEKIPVNLVCRESVLYN